MNGQRDQGRFWQPRSRSPHNSCLTTAHGYGGRVSWELITISIISVVNNGFQAF